LPPLEKAVLIYGVYELFFEQKLQHAKLVINNVLNFSKAYLEKEKIGYINKVLDLLVKEKMDN
jgi:transcription termination factor NusB